VSAWAYALKKGLRSLLAVELASVLTSAVVTFIFNGFSVPGRGVWVELIVIQVLLVLIGFPAMVLSERFELRRISRKKVS
jgi:hypothetical protein